MLQAWSAGLLAVAQVFFIVNLILSLRRGRTATDARTAALGSHHDLDRGPSPRRQDRFGPRWSSSPSIGTRSCAIESRSRTVTARSSSVSKSIVTQ